MASRFDQANMYHKSSPHLKIQLIYLLLFVIGNRNVDLNKREYIIQQLVILLKVTPYCRGDKCLHRDP